MENAEEKTKKFIISFQIPSFVKLSRLESSYQFYWRLSWCY